jgi:hypothetical protein
VARSRGSEEALPASRRARGAAAREEIAARGPAPARLLLALAQPLKPQDEALLSRSALLPRLPGTH